MSHNLISAIILLTEIPVDACTQIEIIYILYIINIVS